MFTVGLALDMAPSGLDHEPRGAVVQGHLSLLLEGTLGRLQDPSDGEGKHCVLSTVLPKLCALMLNRGGADTTLIPRWHCWDMSQERGRERLPQRPAQPH